MIHRRTWWSTTSCNSSTSVSVSGLDAAGHVVQVVARDQWLNVDGEPARLSFDLLAESEVAEGGCGCASTSPGRAGLALGLLGLLAVARRRQRTA